MKSSQNSNRSRRGSSRSLSPRKSVPRNREYSSSTTEEEPDDRDRAALSFNKSSTARKTPPKADVNAESDSGTSLGHKPDSASPTPSDKEDNFVSFNDEEENSFLSLTSKTQREENTDTSDHMAKKRKRSGVGDQNNVSTSERKTGKRVKKNTDDMDDEGMKENALRPIGTLTPLKNGSPTGADRSRPSPPNKRIKLQDDGKYP